jgi:hypothetical protein
MRKVALTILMISTYAFQAWACLGPANIEGVALTSGETLNLQKLMLLGTENVNYFKDGDASAAGIRYMSHYDSRAMVFIGTYGMSYQQNMQMVCLGVILPLADSASVYSPIEKTTFNFAAAVKTELEWLSYNGVVNLSAETIAKIDSALSKAYNGGEQYWTHAHSALAYNSWYTYDSSSGTWRGNGADGVNGVQGVKGTDELAGCSIIKPGVGVPPAGLGTTAITTKKNTVNNRMHSLSVRHTGDGGLIVFLPQAARPGEQLLVIDCRGAVVRKKDLNAGSASLYIEGLAHGHYNARLMR